MAILDAVPVEAVSDRVPRIAAPDFRRILLALILAIPVVLGFALGRSASAIVKSIVWLYAAGREGWERGWMPVRSGTGG